MTDDEAIQRLVQLLFPTWPVDDVLLLRWRRNGVVFEFRPDHNAEHVIMILDGMIGRNHRTFHYEGTQGNWSAHFGDPALVRTHATSWKHAMVRAAIARLQPPVPATAHATNLLANN